MTKTCTAVAGLALALAGTVLARAQVPQGTPLPPVLIESVAGIDSYARYCAPCHGAEGQGNGPVAAALKTRPSDLTGLSRRHGGAFPRAQVAAYIAGAGRPVAAHGSTEMPVWGPIFRAFEPDARAQTRLDNLVAYLESLQALSSLPGERGAQLFRTYCASCHGVAGRGDGPLVAQLRTMPPDLTSFTRRNAGVFPSERVYRIIDGRDVPAHGDREMPVWGDAFRAPRSGMSRADADARIQALVRFLEAIQERATE
jgi:mono/diheme cytochrome c family protein